MGAEGEMPRKSYRIASFSRRSATAAADRSVGEGRISTGYNS